MIKKITTKASCGNGGCSTQPYILPFGWAYEAFDFEAKKQDKLKPRVKSK